MSSPRQIHQNPSQGPQRTEPTENSPLLGSPPEEYWVAIRDDDDDDKDGNSSVISDESEDLVIADPDPPRSPVVSNKSPTLAPQPVSPLSHVRTSHTDAAQHPPPTLHQRLQKVLSSPYLFWNDPATPVSRDSIWDDIRSAITVSLVSVPLSLALSIAGGGVPAQGIVTAFWSGLFAALFGGSEWNIIGPTSALSGVLLNATFNYGGSSILPYIAIQTSMVVLLVWALGLAKYLMFIPSSVVHGFSLGVALIMILGQMDSALGLSFKHSEKEILWKTVETFQHIADAQIPVVILFSASFGTLLFLTRRFNRFPWHMLITLIGILFGYLSSTGVLPFKLRTLNDAYGHVPLNFLQPPAVDLALLFNVSGFRTSLSVVFIAILETLISARLADVMAKTTTHLQSREVFGLGVANAAAGVFGGLPATAALARTSLNIRAGARTRLSAVLAPFALLIISLGAFDYFGYVPMATIAAVLCVVAVNMVEFHEFRVFWKVDMQMFSVAIMTTVICLVEDTMIGLVAGSLLCLLILTDKESVGSCEMWLLRGKDPVAHVDIERLDAQNLIKMPPKRRARGNSIQAVAALSLAGRRNSLDRRVFRLRTDELTPLIPNDLRELPPLRPDAAPKNYSAVDESTSASQLVLPLQPYQSVLKLPAPESRTGSSKALATPFPFGAQMRRGSLAPMLAYPRIQRRELDAEWALEVSELADTLIYHISGSLTYVNAAAHLARNKKFLAFNSNVTAVIFVLRSVGFIDHDGVDFLYEIVRLYRKKASQMVLLFTGVSNMDVRAKLEKYEWFRMKESDGKVLESWTQAVEHLEVMRNQN
ncbi:hypothetical protein M427DRAFT_41367 [Gonapodya prolifera JEL478]|uniref:STAS domain-containing protein n=1 Tax=Gonapodya prolifera (strain JEL478) TaxID=1344416 RepID=A0A139AVD8_GONPJ|nr:hypothetical protein M427DRAFT_41367 [Gonapodya prolifera JEL478]|eukprot:KXS20664.1 hypothetical protein M427DRAFT_41367 [Gonapodya prolifera JEL478]